MTLRPAEALPSKPEPSPDIEAQFRFIVDYTSEAVWRFDLHQPVPINLPLEEQIALFYEHAFLAECNPGMARMYGFPSPAAMCGLPLVQLMPASEASNVDFLRRFIRESYRLLEVESVERDADGRTKHIRNNLVGIVRDGLIFGAVGTSRDVTEYRVARDREKLLADAGTVFNVSLDDVATLTAVAMFLVPRFADWCAIDLVNEAGELERVTVKHQDPAKVQLAEQLFREYPPRKNDPRGAWRVIQTGQPDWSPEIPDELLAAVAYDPRHLQLLRGLGLVSYIVAPIAARGRTLGVLTLVTAESRRAYQADDLAVAMSLAERVALAVENARLYQQSQRDLARVVEAERELEQREHKLRLVTDAIPGLVAYMDADGFYRFANRQYATWFGEAPEQIIGRHMREVLGAAAHQMVQPYFQRALAGEHLDYEIEAPYAHGRTRHIHVYYAPDVGHDGATRGVFVLVLDVSERKRTVEALRTSEERLRHATEAGRLVVWDMDARTGLVKCSANASEVWGITEAPAEEFIARIHPDDREMVRARSAAALGGEPAYSLEYRVVSPDGQIRWLHSRGEVLRDAGGVLVRFTGVSADITERKRTEEAIRASEERLRLITDNVPALISYIERDLRYRFNNAAYLEWFGVPPQALHGRTVQEVLGDEVYRQRQPYLEAALHGQTVRFEGPTRHRQLGLRDTELVYIPDRAASGEVRGFYVFVYDITERKRHEQALHESEERMREMFDSAPAMLWITGPDAQCTFLSHGWMEYTGQPEEEALGLGWVNAVHPADREAAASQFLEANSRRVPFQIEFRLRRADGEYRWAIDAGRPRFSPAREFLGYIGSVIDVHERKAAEDKLRETNAELDRKVRERTLRLEETIGELEAFSYSVSHDLRAPLRAMTGYARALEEDCVDKLDAEHREYLTRISRNAQRLDRLINDVLDYSRLARGEVRLASVSVERVLDDILQQYPTLQPERARITVERPLPAVLGHEALLVQCLSNLLINAVKFVPPGVFPEVQVRATQRDGRVRIEVQDNGIGIAPHNRTRIFGLFQRVNPDSAYEGTGVGLSIVKKAVERLGGSVGVESTEGAGSTFWIELRAAN